MKIAIGSDHGGYHLKHKIIDVLEGGGVTVFDYGAGSDRSCDYPVFAKDVCHAVTSGSGFDFGILVCGTGIGMSIAANKVKGIRAAVCTDEYSAFMARAHNNANVLCIGERVVGAGLALRIVETFLSAKFEGGRHQNRVDMLE